MANIGFTDKQLHVYTRFQDMRRAYEDAHGRTYAPGFLTVLMDDFKGEANKHATVSNFEKIEFMFSGDPGELVCLWYWDWANGNDVCGVLLDNGNVSIKTYDSEGEETGTEEIQAVDFFKRIQTTLNTRQI